MKGKKASFTKCYSHIHNLELYEQNRKVHVPRSRLVREMSSKIQVYPVKQEPWVPDTETEKHPKKYYVSLTQALFLNYITKLRFLRPCFNNQAAIFLLLEIIKICLLFLMSLPLCFDLGFSRWFIFLLLTTWLEGQLLSLGAMRLWSSL